MNRLTKLEKFCEKIGIFNFKTSSFGPYGYALINQIKNEWIKFNFNKFNNNFLIENVDLLDKSIKNFDLISYLENVSNFGVKNQIGLINTYQSQSSNGILFKNRKLETHLNMIYLNDTKSNDQFTEWQHERKQWWSKVLHYPEHLLIENSDLFYQYDDSELKNKIEKFSNLKSFNEIQNFSKFEKLESLVISQTTCETILENILIDSVQFPDDFKLNEQLAQYNIKIKDKIYFNIDFRLAPYKIAFVYSPELAHVKDLANDFKKIFYLKTKHNILLYEIKSDESDLETTYDHLDLMGIPYSVYLPFSVTKDGICKLRNRDTTLCETTHLHLVIQQFNAIVNALIRRKTDTLLREPITELTSLASKLCNNQTPSIVLESDSCPSLTKATAYKQESR